MTRSITISIPGVPEKEKDFTQQVRDLARALGWLEYHPYRSDRSTPGFPDLVMVKAPRVIFAELKMAKGKVSHSQEIWLQELNDCGGVETYLWRPQDRQEIADCLSGRGGASFEITVTEAE